MHSLMFLLAFDDFEEFFRPVHELVGVFEEQLEEELPELKFSDLIAGAAVVVVKLVTGK
jgi:hypothetical protein